MSFAIRPRSALPSALAALAAAALLAAPSPASAELGEPAGGCPEVATVQPFTAWQDTADYILAPDGGFEAGAAGWTLEGGARAVAGNEPFQVGSADDAMSLSLPAGGAATTAPMCIGQEHRTMRFFASAAPSSSARLVVQAIYAKRDGLTKVVRLGAIAPTGDWSPTDALPMRVNERADDYDNALSVSLRFAPGGDEDWRIDDVYVDPFRTR